MSRLLTRALVAVAAPVLSLALVAAPADAAGKADVPSLDQAATVYPHLTGGTATESPVKVKGMAKNCKFKTVRGASGVSVSYQAPVNYEDPSSFSATGAKPYVSTTAYKFRSVKDAIAFLHPPKAFYKKCPKGSYDPKNPGGGSNGGCTSKASMQKIKYKLGDERTGFQMSMSGCGSQGVIQMFTVRDGKDIVMSTMMSMDGSAPSKDQSLKFVKLALNVAR